MRSVSQPKTAVATLLRRPLNLASKGQAKIGNYRVSFTDLSIPLAGIPITIGRTYDTLDAPYSKDFGYGWKLDVATPRIRESVRVSASEAAGGGPLGANPFRMGTRVYMNTPDGRRVGFTFTPEVSAGFAGSDLDTQVSRLIQALIID